MIFMVLLRIQTIFHLNFLFLDCTMNTTPSPDSKRFGVRRRTFKKGKITYDGNSSRNCQLKDISKHGALLGFEIGFECPKHFTLNIPDGALEGDTYDCEVMSWRDKNQVGVSFVKKHAKNNQAFEIEEKVELDAEALKQSVKEIAGIEKNEAPNEPSEVTQTPTDKTKSHNHVLAANTAINMLETFANTSPKEIAEKLLAEIQNYPEATLAITKDCQKGALNLMEAVLEVTEKHLATSTIRISGS